MNAIFYISSAVAIVSTLLVITRYNAVHALLYLIVSLLSVAMVFFTLGAPFVAALEVIIYAGAIMVLFLFVIMILNLGQSTTQQEKAWLQPRMWIGPGVLASVLMLELMYSLSLAGKPLGAHELISPQQVGGSLFRPYLLGVELASILLLAGLVGAYHLGRREKGSEPKRGIA